MADDDVKFMRAAFAAAEEGMRRGQSPFGAVVVRDGEIIGRGYNTVLLDNDPTAHAEINAIRQASRRLKNWNLEGAVIYSTTEPCPMCFSAIHWARINRIVYSTRIEDVARLGFNEMRIHNHTLRALARLDVEITPDFLRDEGLALLRKWKGQPY